MDVKKRNVKVVSGALVGLMLMSAGGIGYAASTKNENADGNVNQRGKMQMAQKGEKVDLTAKLAELVTAGSITQEQSDKIVAFMNAQQATRTVGQKKVAATTEAERKANFETNKPAQNDMLGSLVTDGTLTQEQADLVMQAMRPEGKGGKGGFGGLNINQTKLTTEEMQAKMEEQMAKQKEEMATTLAEAVANGTITQAEADELITYVDAKEAERKTQMEANKENWQAGEKPANDGIQMDKSMQGPFGCAVTDGIITADQANAIGDITKAKNEAARAQEVATELANIVTAGTITQDQSDEIVAAMEQEKVDRLAEQEKVQAMTEAERQAYFEENKGERETPLANLVSDGTLTQEQADAVMQAIRQDAGMGIQGGGHKMRGNFGNRAPQGDMPANDVE